VPIHPGFQLFGQQHLLALSLVVLGALVVPLGVRFLRPDAARPVALALAAMLLIQEGAQLVLTAMATGPSVALLPLHLCTLAVYLTAWTLVVRAQLAYELIYFWGLGGTTQALLTPDLVQGFPAPAFLFFFLGHGLVIVGVSYATFVYRLRPYPVSILRTATLTLTLAAGIYFVNLWLGTNFLYLMAKPARPSLLDWFGPWPWYWFGLLGAGLFSFLLLYVPFMLVDLLKGRSILDPRLAALTDSRSAGHEGEISRSYTSGP
jgi:hypothetical integral membrane protein (TIGR02206 family)